ncbi:MAG: DUF2075 domain-containing protein [Paludibacteraceae bacterium]|nr:DUF2075 domain-containing protein [Paludibacteraceae bacterium]MBO4519460.1 DUF2075 domain-containing protein [Paludibacteraceae bacterium]
MIIYRNTKGGFRRDVRENLIAEKIENAFFEHCIAHNNNAEYRSWANSMQYMCNVLDDNDISDDCNVAIEYQIPLTAKRIDFLIAGKDEQNRQNVVIIELKQWETSEATSRADVVQAFTGGANRYVAHPSYQAYSYAQTIASFNEAVATEQIHLIPCVYLHNYKEESRKNIDETHYREAVQAAPIFLGRDAIKLRTFIKQFIHQRAGKDLLMTIENGKIRPSKSLQDTLASMLKGNAEFCLIDEQKVAYETVRKKLENVLKGKDHKSTIIIKGGPGTGKSVVAIQLLCDLIQKDYTALYVTKNAAPRNVYFAKLRQDKYSLNYINSLFRSAFSFIDAPSSSIDCILADEAHRLMQNSGRYKPGSKPQAYDIINAAKVSVFFIDEEQKVTTADACTIDTIRQYAKILGSEIIEGEDYNLTSQFRCNGSDSYLALINSILGMHSSPNALLDLDYDIQVFDSPTKMREALRTKNLINNKSRMLAGYCYEWKSQNDASAMDIRLEDGFEAQWNFGDTKTWAIDPDSFDQVGCIHTSQGLEFDYVGVIIGRDLIYRNNQVQTDVRQRAHTDHSLNGSKGNVSLADTIIRNTYKTLLTRGQKGCYIYCEDKALADYIRQLIEAMKPSQVVPTITPLMPEKTSPILQDVDEDEKYISLFPVYTVRAACGYFGDMEPVSMLGWMRVPWNTRKDRNKFIVQAVGHSMESRIHDGDYCLFERYTGGSREGKIVLAEHHGEVDSDYEGAYSIKVYHSKKVYDEDGSWQHESITLQPLNRDYEPICINVEDAESFRIIGEFVDTIEVE